MEKATKLSDIQQDPTNFNKHTEIGMSMLEKSIRKFGFVEAGLISEDDVICSGNARQETAVNIGMEDVQIIDIDGTKPVYLRKKGLQSGSQEFKELGLALNQVGKMNVVIDAVLVEAELGEAVCEEWFVEKEKHIEGNSDELKDLSDKIKTEFKIEVICKDETEQEQTYNQLIENGYECRILTL